MSKYAKRIFAILGLVAVVVAGAKATCYFAGSCQTKKVSSAESNELEALGVTVRTYARESDTTAMRAWLKSSGPKTTRDLALSYDNTTDSRGKARMFILSTIASLADDGIKSEEVAVWAPALRELAMALLHKGDAQSDWIAQSYLMEGNADKAAALYRSMLDLPKESIGYKKAELFFQQNPNLRSPASR